MEGRIRVLQLVRDFSLGGAERMVVHLLRGLDRERFDVAAVSLRGPLGTELEAELGQHGLPVTCLGKKPGFDGRVLLRLDRALRKAGPQVVHTHTGALRYALPSIVARRIPVKVHTVHNVAHREAPSAHRIHRLAFRLGVVPVAIGPGLVEDVKAFYGVKDSPMIPNGIPVARYRPPEGFDRGAWRRGEGVPEAAPLFASIGRLAPQKDHDILLRAFARVHEHRPDAVLWIAGEGELRGALQARIAALGLEGAARLLGNRRDVPELLAAADVFVLSSRYEGNPLTVMEAMAAGLAVIATGVGAVPSLVRDGETGLLVAPGDEEGLARAMGDLLREPARAAELGRAAARFAQEHLDASLMVRRYERLYEELLGRGPRGERLPQ